VFNSNNKDEREETFSMIRAMTLPQKTKERRRRDFMMGSRGEA
jgi:hypothetical protein